MTCQKLDESAPLQWERQAYVNRNPYRIIAAETNDQEDVQYVLRRKSKRFVSVP